MGSASADGRSRSSARGRRDPTAGEGFASSAGVRSRMQSQKTRDTKPELAVRSLLHAAGFRYRVDRAPLPGVRRRADLVFARAQVAVFIDGCFWHSCPEHGMIPGKNTDWWREKFEVNRARDADTDARLLDAGWLPARFWEHEDPAEVAETIAATVSRRLAELTGDP